MNEFEEELQRVLRSVAPALSWSTALSAAGLDGPDVWHQEDPDLWPMSCPPEDYALPPLVLWTEDLRLLAEKAYRTTYDRCLEPGESYEFIWPPRGALWCTGSWCHPNSDDDSNAGPDTASDEVDAVIEPATWVWHLEVDRVGDDSVEAEDPWLMGRTEVDPRTVEYSVFGGDGADEYVEVLQKVVARAARGDR